MMIKSMGKLGEFYQNMTGKSYKNLVENLYKLSMGTSATAVLGLNVYFLPTVFLTYLRSLNPNFQTSIEEENKLEAESKNKDSGKLGRTGMLILGCAYTAITLDLIKDFSEEKSILNEVFKFGFVSGIPSYFVFSMAEYMKLSQPPEPPKKTIPMKIKGKLERLISNPLPVS